MTALPLFVEAEPDFRNRSALKIAPGQWLMRNGHIAEVKSRTDLEYGEGFPKKKFPIWKGACITCGEPRTWNLNGTYAAVGKHDYDIVGLA